MVSRSRRQRWHGAQQAIDRPAAAEVAGPPQPGRSGLPAASAPGTFRDSEEDAQTAVALFGGATRKGRWEPPAVHRVLVVCGGAQLDYTRAELLEGESVVEILCLFGGVEIRVPPDIDVVTEGTAIFGGFSHTDQRGSDPDPPRLRIQGLALFGGVEVKGPKKKRRRHR